MSRKHGGLAQSQGPGLLASDWAGDTCRVRPRWARSHELEAVTM